VQQLLLHHLSTVVFAAALLLPCRLSPSDIHRLHASVTGTVVKIARRGNRFMASEFAAMHSRLDIMVDNDRLVMEFDTNEFGTVVQVRLLTQDCGSDCCKVPVSIDMTNAL
jgi:phosphatidylserine decarboxylase